MTEYRGSRKYGNINRTQWIFLVAENPVLIKYAKFPHNLQRKAKLFISTYVNLGRDS